MNVHTFCFFIRRGRSKFGPSPGKTLCVFVDDLNMPAKEKYGAQPPIEILRQYIDQGYWFDRCVNTCQLLVRQVREHVQAASSTGA